MGKLHTRKRPTFEALPMIIQLQNDRAELIVALKALLAEAEAFAQAIPAYGNSVPLNSARALIAKLGG